MKYLIIVCSPLICAVLAMGLFSDTCKEDHHIAAGAVTYESCANSYMVAPNGTTIYIPVNRANVHKPGTISSATQFTVELLWMDAKGLIASLSPEGIGAGGAIKVTTNATGIQGNAHIAVKVGGAIKWSWHIWVTDYTPSGIWMDRNLGAISINEDDGAACFGLYYQWGRKDPFPGAASVCGKEPVLYSSLSDEVGALYDMAHASVGESQHIPYTIAHPSTFIARNPWDAAATASDKNWNNSVGGKTLYDPCPKGWRVPGHKPASACSDCKWELCARGYINSAYGGYYPAAGLRQYNKSGNTLSYVGMNGYYWSGDTPKNGSSNAYTLYFTDTVLLSAFSQSRALGCAVRCVVE